MFLFNLFLRFTPFAPNWFINVASPVVGVPIVPFFFGSLFGTQLSLLFLTLTGSTLKELGANFELGPAFQKKAVGLALTMGMLQCVPIALIWRRKQIAKAQSQAAKRA